MRRRLRRQETILLFADDAWLVTHCGDAGWISGIIEGTATCYQLDEKNIAWFRSVIGEIF